MNEDVMFFRQCIEKGYFTVDTVARLTNLDIELVSDVLAGKKTLEVQHRKQFCKGARKVRELICKVKKIELKKRHFNEIEDEELRLEIAKSIIVSEGL